MLRVTRSPTDGSGVVLRIEGRLVEDWIAVLEEEVETIRRLGFDVELDLSALTGVDRHGAQCVRALERRGIRLSGCTGLIADLLDQ